MSKSVVVLGSLNMDLCFQSARFPRAGETIHGQHFLSGSGGKGANQAVACAKQGASVEMIGCVGKDGFGQELKGSLAKAQVGVDWVFEREGVATGVAAILLNAEGQNSIIVIEGANGELTPKLLSEAKETIQQASCLVCQFETPLETVFDAIDMAHRAGVPVVLNPSPFQNFDTHLLSKLAYLVVNEVEAGDLLQIRIQSVEDAKQAVLKLQDLGVKHAIITLGDKGVVACDKADVWTFPAYQTRVVDTTAAGDTFIGAFCASLMRQESLQTALNDGQLAASLAVSKKGAQDSIPTLEDTQKLLSQQRSSS